MSNFESHQRAAQMHDAAAHAHLTAASAHEKQDHLTGSELSRQALEHSQKAQFLTGQAKRSFSHAEIAALAHEFWLARGCPAHSADQDWGQALETLRSRANGL